MTNNAKTFVNVPARIPFDGELVIRGEAVISYSDFEKINAEVLISNLEANTSFAFEESIKNGKLIPERILEVEDDKNPNLKHKVLFLGISPVNLVSYQKNLMLPTV